MIAFLIGLTIGLFVFGTVLHKMPDLSEKSLSEDPNACQCRDEDGVPLNQCYDCPR
jgi:hypothetical protein